jgi:hypothetical protein
VTRLFFLQYFEDKQSRRKQNAPELYLFTTEWKRFDWFGWGDWLYLITSVLAWAQTFFMFNSSITDDDGDAYYLVGMFCFHILTQFLSQHLSNA